VAANAAALALVAVVPLVALVLTGFVKVSVVLSLLRTALGIPDAPSGLVITGLSLVLTMFIMAPVVIDMANAAANGPAQVVPAPAAPDAGSMDAAVHALVPPEYAHDVDVAERAMAPLRAFLLAHAAPADRATFVSLAKQRGRDVKGDELWVVAPAFAASQLREAFAIAVVIFVPFLVIDLVVSLGLAALGLHTTRPEIVALPLKLLLFVAVDGWRMLLDSLVRGYV
jgi:type III secretion protein R